jgi:hypothetical protein
MKATKVILVLACFLASMGACSAKNEEGVGLTIYNDNFAVVRQARQMGFEAGINTVKFTDVAAAIDPTSVNFKCLSAPGAISILEQNYEYDLVHSETLLKRYIDRDVTVIIGGSGSDGARELSGKLLAAVGGEYILASDTGGIEVVNRSRVEEISLQELPEDLVTRPTLVWLASAKEAGSKLCQVTYTTEQINWKADYSAVLSDDETSLDFSGWVTIDNKSGATYKNAALKLIAGDVRRIAKPRLRRRPMVEYDMAALGGAGFEEKAFMEYHMYTLGRKSTINNNQVKQIEFIEPALGVAAKKLFIYDRQENAEKMQVKIEFVNTKENKLGIALPKGKVRVFKKDPADESLEFVGEDEIDHTPRKEKLLLYIGNAFDIVPEYKLVDSKHGRRTRTETHQVELRNRKDTPIEVCVDEKFMRWANWEVLEKSHDFEKHDAYTARFKVKIPADSTETIKYTVRQWW